MINFNKRNFIKNSLFLFVAVTSANISKIFADWPSKIFNARSSNNVINALANDSNINESELIAIKAPDIAENGGVVPVTVSTELENVKNIAILVENNPSPLTSSFSINSRATPYVSTRVKMAKTSNITAIVATDDGYYRASRSIKVTIGGCGG